MDGRFLVRVLPAALDDMRDACDYIEVELDSPRASLQLIDCIEGALRSLEHMPYRHRLYPVTHPTQHETRFLCVGNYLLLYWVDAEKDEVVVSRFMYGGRRVQGLIDS